MCSDALRFVVMRSYHGFWGFFDVGKESCAVTSNCSQSEIWAMRRIRSARSWGMGPAGGIIVYRGQHGRKKSRCGGSRAGLTPNFQQRRGFKFIQKNHQLGPLALYSLDWYKEGLSDAPGGERLVILPVWRPVRLQWDLTGSPKPQSHDDGALRLDFRPMQRVPEPRDYMKRTAVLQNTPR